MSIDDVHRPMPETDRASFFLHYYYPYNIKIRLF
jgi:hypothetical protein